MIIKSIRIFLEKVKAANNSLINEIVSKNKIVIKYILSFLSGIRLKIEARKCRNLEDFINLGLNFEYAPIRGIPFKQIFRTMQNKRELTEFIKIIASISPKVVLEIGTARGGTLFLLSLFSNADAHIISLDLPGGIHGGGYPRSRILFYKSFVSRSQKLSLVREDSHDPSTLKKIKKLLNSQKLDLLFIDGDHTYEGVKKDFEMYGPLVKDEGIIAFHDIAIHPPELNCHVDEFWQEIKYKFDFNEILFEEDPDKLGIGIIKKKGINSGVSSFS